MSKGGNLDIGRPVRSATRAANRDFQVAPHANENTPPRKRTSKSFRFIGLSVAVVVTTATWLLILSVASRMFGFGVSTGFTIGFVIFVAMISTMGLALVMSN